MGGLVLPRQGATNLQTFRGAVGGVAASAITDSGDSKRPFGVDGDTFVCGVGPLSFDAYSSC